ncbi:sugar transferase [Jeotgalibacillus sp. S-D1]|uniref:sugar transferase n=1 Tax=Jeotgalibacillus sp. S-D1 TaxID=2552189 RepID=UPI001059E91C|nr:sugar transferase [Jeotgalibacillus sp. S-D1]TDL32517.1 sugar transferase [Jeotgalibacillus sp. S-D1]
MKRLVDLTLSSILLVVLFPLFVFLFCMIYLRIGSPVFFTQIRAGKDGEAFTIYKFRTMTNAVSKDGKLLSDEERLTPFGQLIRRYSLDELPQLVNVVKGNMSFIGPRPLLMEYVPLYSAEQKKRLSVKPGVTGWAQVNGRNSINWEEKFSLDVWYVENQSFRLDMKIFFMTISRVIRPVGISQQNQATMERFTGTRDDQTDVINQADLSTEKKIVNAYGQSKIVYEGKEEHNE